MGLGGPMNWWDPELCTMLAEAGFHVVRYDNRDTGRSSRIKGRVTRRQLVQSFVGRGGRPPYTLSDMAGDAFGLMDHLGWDDAHVVGVSMGGMIVQTMAVEQPRAGALDDLDHVHARQAHASAGSTPRCCRCCSPTAGRRQGGVRRHVGQDVAGDRLPGVPPEPSEKVRDRAPRRPSTAACPPAA